uniref:RING-type domain-containing protein n=1 Tax=Tetranychus urticae TaxID=32264 RepID=A0A158P4J0_TETUR
MNQQNQSMMTNHVMSVKFAFSAEISVVFKPCEHMITCYDCAPQFNKCPWCKATIFTAVRCIVST